MSILEFIGIKKTKQKQDNTQTESIREIISALDQMDEGQAKLIAAFAYLLTRVANVDLNISPEETRKMEQLVVTQGGLSEEQALLVVQMAKTHSRLFAGTQNFLVTREFDRLATHSQKIALLHCLFEVSSADQSISSQEDGEITQIATELHIDRREVSGLRAQFKQHLAVLKDPSEKT